MARPGEARAQADAGERLHSSHSPLQVKLKKALTHLFIAIFQGEVLCDRPVSVAGGVHSVPRLPAGGEPTQIPPGKKFSNVFAQVKRDLATGRLIAPISTVCLLASYAVQSTLGDHDPDSCRSGYLEPFQVNFFLL